MKGLIIKDILNLRRSFKTTLLIICLFAIYAYGTNNPSYLISMVVLILTMMSITSIAYDDMAKWDRYALAMPISRKDIVISKYVLSILLSIVSVLVSFIVTYILILPRADISIKELLLIAYVVFSISLIFVSMILPFIYKFGVEKARIISIGIFAIPTAILFLLHKIELELPDENQLMFLLKISPLILILILFSSGLFSYIIYKNKDI